MSQLCEKNPDNKSRNSRTFPGGAEVFLTLTQVFASKNIY